MNVLVLQLSDLHIRENATQVVARSTGVAAAAQGLHSDIALCVVALTGDIAYSGQGEEYQNAVDLVSRLSEALKETLDGIPIIWAAIPGNHDCDLSETQRARPAITDSILKASAPPIDTSEIDLCTTVQDEFFAFRDLIEDQSLRLPVAAHQRLYFEYAVPDKTGKSGHYLLIRCCNSAWLSTKPEVQGRLYFPPAAIRGKDSQASLSIVLIHHPYNWLRSDNARAVRSKLEAVADVILTGHEHSPARRETRNEIGELNLYVEGGVLNDNDHPQDSSFNILLLDTDERRQKVFRFLWNGDLFEPSSLDIEWEPLQARRLSAGASFTISDAHRRFLEDPELALKTRDDEEIRLSDFFVPPDLRRVESDDADSRLINSAVALKVGGDSVLITAPEQAGKTALAKQFCLQCIDSGHVPIFIKGTELRVNSEEALARAIRKASGEQYGEDNVERFRQLARSQKVIIVDDVDSIRFGKIGLRHFTELLGKEAGQILLVTDEIAHQVGEAADAESGAEGAGGIKHYRLQPFGHSRRLELAERWFMRNPELAADANALANDIMAVKHTLDTVIGRNFVPAYPVFLVAMLQAQEVNARVDLNASTHGYFYELLIRNALARGSTVAQFGVKLAYLTFMAHWLYDHGKREITEAEFREIHGEYRKRRLIDLSFVDIEKELLRCDILKVEVVDDGDASVAADRRYRFKYPYIFYYFFASALRDALTSGKGEDTVTTLAGSLTDTESANILVFLAHLSNDSVIIDAMLKQAEAQFKHIQAITLDDNSLFLGGELSQLVEKVVYEDRDTREERKRTFREIDEADEEQHKVGQEPTAERQDEVTAYMESIKAAFANLQILGQILKNFSGALEVEPKIRILRECYAIGFRTLGSLFDLVRGNTTNVIEAYVETVRSEYPDLSATQLTERAKRTIAGMLFITAYATVRRIAYAVGAPELMPLYETVRSEDSPPSEDLVFALLKLTQSANFPKDALVDLYNELQDDRVAQGLLRSMVVQHFYLFDVPAQVKSSACELLDITYQRVQFSASPRGKLVQRDPKRLKDET